MSLDNQRVTYTKNPKKSLVRIYYLVTICRLDVCFCKIGDAAFAALFICAIYQRCSRTDVFCALSEMQREPGTTDGTDNGTRTNENTSNMLSILWYKFR